MKTTWTIGFLILSSLATPAQQSQPGTTAESAFSVSERGPHHKVWERIEYRPAPDGTMVEFPRSYQELATGMHFKNARGEWEESEDKIEILPNNAGAVAFRGQHKAIFPPEIKTGVIELQTPDGQWIRSRVWGLSYFDSASGESVLLAEVKESDGQVVGDNVVVYPDAFTDILADVRYTYTRAGFEQDLVLRENPPAPEEFGLNPKTTRLQALTEFVEAATPSKMRRQESGLPDHTLGFGEITIGLGKAFSVDAEGQTGENIPVAKQWERLENRDFLIEEVQYEKVTEQLQKLPAVEKYEGASLQRRGNGESVLAGLKTLMPKRYAKAAPSPTDKPKRMAKASYDPGSSFVLDYVSLISSLTNYTFKGDTTYYISGALSSFGTNTFEGGAVIKYATNAALNITPGPVGNPKIIFLSDAYRPVVFTAKDDNSVGETIAGSTGNPTVANYANPALLIANPGVSTVLAHFRIAYAKQALYLTANGSYQVSHGQIVNCGLGVMGGGITPYVGNTLFANVRTNFNLSGGTGAVAENVTFKGSDYLQTGPGAGQVLTFTNCLFANVTNLSTGGVTITGGNNGFHNSFGGSPFGSATVAISTYPFRTIGGGGYYLTNNSAALNAGTTNINAGLLASLRTKTTYPPIAYSNVTFTAAQTFSPQAQRDTDTPDLGYHYDPLDYNFGGCTASTNLTFGAGTVVGWFRTTSGWTRAGQGIRMNGDITISFEGTATAPTYFVRLNTVQENDRTAGYGHGGIVNFYTPYEPMVRGRFVRCSAMANEVFGGYFADDWGAIRAEMTHTEFWSGNQVTYGNDISFTNCLMRRVGVLGVNNGAAGYYFTMRNCTVIGGLLHMNRNSAGTMPVSIRDTAFDGTLLSGSDYYGSNGTWTDYDFNAYTNTTNPFPIGGANDVVVTNFNWQPSWLGKFYLPSDSPLIEVGNVTAPTVGLYHFTTQTNEYSSETTSQVDIGYHYVGVDSSGNPLDSDGDGTPDYLEDGNGNGTVESGETDWNSATDFGLRVFITEPKRSANLP